MKCCCVFTVGRPILFCWSSHLLLEREKMGVSQPERVNANYPDRQMSIQWGCRRMCAIFSLLTMPAVHCCNQASLDCVKSVWNFKQLKKQLKKREK